MHLLQPNKTAVRRLVMSCCRIVDCIRAGYKNDLAAAIHSYLAIDSEKPNGMLLYGSNVSKLKTDMRECPSNYRDFFYRPIVDEAAVGGYVMLVIHTTVSQRRLQDMSLDTLVWHSVLPESDISKEVLGTRGTCTVDLATRWSAIILANPGWLV